MSGGCREWVGSHGVRQQALEARRGAVEAGSEPYDERGKARAAQEAAGDNGGREPVRKGGCGGSKGADVLLDGA